MSASAGSKRLATTPVASPSKAASKRSRTQYDYGDDDDLEPSPQAGRQESIGDPDSGVMVDDVDMEVLMRVQEMMDEMESRSVYRKDRKITGVSTVGQSRWMWQKQIY